MVQEREKTNVMKLLSELMIALLLICTVGFVYNAKPLKADWEGSCITIKSDGSIDPSTAPIERNGDIYTLTGDIYIADDDGILIQRDNMTLDGAGHTLEGNAGQPWATAGINLAWRSNITITRITVKAFCIGIMLHYSDNNTIIENNIVENIYDGIWFYWSLYCHNNLIIGNRFVDNFEGIYFYMSTHEETTGNKVYHNDFIGNWRQAYEIVGCDAWDDGYPSGGNYWNDYKGIDEKSGPNQDQPGSDGIGDLPYDGNGFQDRYPLMKTIPQDIYVVDVEIVQVVPNARALVKDKDTAIRVDIMNTFSQDQTVNIDVTYNFGGRYLEEGRNRGGIRIKEGLNRVYLPGGPIYRKQGNSWIKVDSSWWPVVDGEWQPEFFFRWATTGTDGDIRVRVEFSDEETSKGNNEMIAPACDIVESKQLSILFIPIRFPGDPSFPSNLDAIVDDWLDFLRGTYPLSEENLVSSIFPVINWPIPPMIENPSTNEAKLLAQIWFYMTIAQPICEPASLLVDRVVFILPNAGRVIGASGSAIGMGAPWPLRNPVPVVIDADWADTNVNGGTLANDQSRFALAHEIGHTFYLWHPHDIGPHEGSVQYPPQTQRFWVERRDYEQTASSLMSYDPIFGQYYRMWVDSGRFDSNPLSGIQSFDGPWNLHWNLFDQLTVGLPDLIGALPPVPPYENIPLVLEHTLLQFSDPEVLVLTGSLFKNETIDASRPWHRLPEGTPNLTPGHIGNYSIILIDEDSTVLSQIGFNATFMYSAQINDTIVEMNVDALPFVFTVPYVDGTKLVEIRNATGHVLASRIITSGSPEVSIVYPNGGEILTAGNHMISWNASDSDSDDLIYTIAYSSDGGDKWFPIAFNLNETNYSWSTSNMETSDYYYIKVIASDGVNIGEDISNDQFTVDPHSPTFNILSPQNKTYYSNSVPLIFTLDETCSWMGYSLDSQPNATIYENAAINIRDGSHRLIVYANDTAGNMGVSGMIYFTVNSSVYDPWRTSLIGLDGYPIVDFAVYYDALYAISDDNIYIYDNGSRTWDMKKVSTYLLSIETCEDHILVGGQGGLHYFEDTLHPILSVTSYIKVLGAYNGTIYAGTMLDKIPTLYVCNVSESGLSDPSDWHIDTEFSSILNFSGPFGSIDSFAVFNDEIYVTSGNKVLRYNGSDWNLEKVYGDVNAFLDMSVYGGKLYLATRDQGWRKPLYQGGTGFSGRVIEYDGENWTTILDHDYWIFSLETYENKLYAGTADEILIYNGTHWSTSFNALERAYYGISLTVFDGKIYAGIGNGYIFEDPINETDFQSESLPSATIPEFSPTTLAVFLIILSLLSVLFAKRGFRKGSGTTL